MFLKGHQFIAYYFLKETYSVSISVNSVLAGETPDVVLHGGPVRSGSVRFGAPESTHCMSLVSVPPARRGDYAASEWDLLSGSSRCVSGVCGTWGTLNRIINSFPPCFTITFFMSPPPITSLTGER